MRVIVTSFQKPTGQATQAYDIEKVEEQVRVWCRQWALSRCEILLRHED